MHWLGFVLNIFLAFFIAIVGLLFIFVIDPSNTNSPILPFVLFAVALIPLTFGVLQLKSEPRKQPGTTLSLGVGVAVGILGGVLGYCALYGALLVVFVMKPFDASLAAVCVWVGVGIVTVLGWLCSRGGNALRPNLLRWLILPILWFGTMAFSIIGLILIFAIPNAPTNAFWTTVVTAPLAFFGPGSWLIVRERVAVQPVQTGTN